MAVKIGLGLVIVLLVFLSYVSTKDGHFSYERSGFINAPADKIYPYISQLGLGGQWNTYEKRDPNMKKQITGTDGQPGAKMVFVGNREAGTGTLEILNTVPNQSTDIQLIMTQPMSVSHVVKYRLTPEGSGTRFSWAMVGDGGFASKLMTTFIDCEKMIGKDFDEGINNLKVLVESQK